MSGPAMATDPRPSIPPGSAAAAAVPCHGRPAATSATAATAVTRWSGATGISWANGSWTTLPQSAVNVDRIIENARIPAPDTVAFQHEGTAAAAAARGRLDVFFLNSVRALSEGNAVTNAGQSLKERLSDKFAIPDFFWSHAAYEANGFFFASQPDEGSGHPKSCHASISRFLMKQITPNKNGRGQAYHWHYVAFATYWYPSQKGPVQVVLCFDLPRMNGGAPLLRDKYKDELVKAFKSPAAAQWRTCPFAVYSIIGSVITRSFDEALWTFQEPVRKFEKSRTRLEAQANGIEFISMEKRFIKMHELSRHVIHTTETLQVTARTLASIRNHHNRCHKAAEARAGRSSTENAVHGQECNENECIPEMFFYQEFIENLRLRAGAFNKRMRNEIRLSFHLSSADDNVTAKQILQDGRNDGRELTQLVSTATLLFLPGTFVSGFFGMNFFGTDGLGDWRRIWIFFVITVPLTASAFLTRYFYQKKVRGKKQLQVGDVEDAPGIFSLRRLSNRWG